MRTRSSSGLARKACCQAGLRTMARNFWYSTSSLHKVSPCISNVCVPYRVDHSRVVQQLHAACQRESFAKQEIAVAVHEVDRHAALGQRVERARDLLRKRLGQAFVADPVFEKIAEHVERIARGCRLAQEVQQRARRRGRIGDRCRSEINKVWGMEKGTCVSPRPRFFLQSPVMGEARYPAKSGASQSNDFGLLDDHVFRGHVLVKAAIAGGNGLDLVHHVAAFHDFSKKRSNRNRRRWRSGNSGSCCWRH